MATHAFEGCAKRSCSSLILMKETAEQVDASCLVAPPTLLLLTNDGQPAPPTPASR
jgi:hypothetical protein